MNQIELAEIRFQKIEQWEEQYFAHDRGDLALSYSKWNERAYNQIGERRKGKLLKALDACIVHLQAWIGQSSSNKEVENRVLLHAKVFEPEIKSVEDLKALPLEQLDYIAEQLMAKQRLLALGQGGITGMGGAFLLAIDIPAVALIQLKSLQHLALVYGYDVRKPAELMILLKLFHVATLPKAYQKEEWDNLFLEVMEQDQEMIFYQGEEAILKSEWLEQMTNQMAKGFVIAMLKKKVIQGVPLIGMAVGAGLNYQFSKQVIQVGQHFYQKRRLVEQLSE